MSEATTQAVSQEGMTGMVDDWGADRQAYHVPWGKAMMWIFLVSDTFNFSCFLASRCTLFMVSGVEIYPFTPVGLPD